MSRRKREFRHAHPWRDKKTGRLYIKFRKNGVQKMLPGPWGSDAFRDAYYAALGNTIEPGKSLRSKAGSISAAIAAYYLDHAFKTNLSPGTQGMRRPILERFRAYRDKPGLPMMGEHPLARLEPHHIEEYLKHLQPHAARNTLKALRGWLQHAKHDVTVGMPLPKADSTPHHSWTDDEIAQFEARHPVGSKARMCFALAKYTGQARSDIARMGRQNIVNGVLTVMRRKKTKVDIYVPIHPELQTVIDGTPGNHLTFLVTKTGRPYAPSDLSEQFGVWCDEAGLPDRCVMHGMRHATGALLANLGLNAKRIAAILACSEKNAMHYSQAADKKLASNTAMDAWIASTNGQPKVSNPNPGLTNPAPNALISNGKN